MLDLERAILERRFMEAYESNSGALFLYCYKKAFNRRKAKMYVEEVFRKTWVHMAGRGDIKDLPAFLYAAADAVIARNEAKRTASVRSIAQKFHKTFGGLYASLQSKS